MKRLRPTSATLSPNGYILMLVLISAFVFTVALMGITNLSFATYKAARHAYLNLDSLSVAEGGADAAVVALNTAAATNGTYTGTTAPVSNVCAMANSSAKTANAVTLYSNATQGKATYETCIQDNSDSSAGRYEKVMYSIGKVYQPTTATTPTSVTRLKIILEGSPTSGGYSVQTGPGGLVLSNSATVTNGNVYVGGGITMSNTASIGSASSPANVYAANYLCPKTSPYSGYPALCGSGQPISISNSAHIYGSIYANGQTTTTGFSNPGLVQSSGVANVTMPDFDRASQKAAVTTTLTGNQSCSGSSTVTYLANTKIAGNLSISNNCTVIMKGNVWVTGNVSVSNNGIIKADSTVSSTIHLMIDGSSGISLSNQSSMASNANGYGFEVVTMYSTAPCNPDCTTVTGSDLVNSTNVTTINLNNQSLAAASTFYARWTGLSLSNGGNIGAILAQKITMSNTGNIVFGQNSAAPTSYSWSVRYYEQMPVKDAQTTN